MREANLLETDGLSNDKNLEHTYQYDLELDGSFNILGGESMTKNLPDFIWASTDKTYPLSRPEKLRAPRTQAEVVKSAQQASKLGMPLSVIVKKLFESAK
jgi:hypothetical protein